MSSLPSELARVLHVHRQAVVPLVGAGLATAAGVPGTNEVALALRSYANEQGRPFNDDIASFSEVCKATEERFGLDVLQDVTAQTVLSTDPDPDAALRALVRCPSQLVLTTNYDRSIEAAVVSSDRKALTFGPDEAAAWAPPQEGTVHVVHLHGDASRPRTMVFPGPSTTALEDDEVFKTTWRALAAPRPILYAGFAFSEAETHLRKELDWLAGRFSDSGEHHLLLPQSEANARDSELAELLSKPKVTGHFYDDQIEQHRPVLHAALILAPKPAPDGAFVADRAPRLDPWFRPLPIVRASTTDGAEQIATIAMSAEYGIQGYGYDQPKDVVAAGRVVLEGAPGMGKTQTMLAAACSAGERSVLFVKVSSFVGLLPKGPDPLSGALQALGAAAAFDAHTRYPTRKALDTATYGFLFDGLDEVAPDERRRALEAILALAERFPQHSYAVATRPTVDIAQLYNEGFVRRVLHPSSFWGSAYMAERSVPKDRLDDFKDRLPMVSELIAVPLYASAIATMLTDSDYDSTPEASRPASPLELIREMAKSALRRDANRVDQDPEPYLKFLERVATVLQLRGLPQATVEALREIETPGAETTESVRERMIERALLADLEGVMSFPLRVVQEALCADAILGAPNPVSAVRDVAVARLADQDALRGDIDHVLDLVWESAPPDLRDKLCDVDELRFARTQDPTSVIGAERALDILWRWFDQRRIWLTNEDDQRQIRGAETAVERLLKASPQRAEKRRGFLVRASRAEEPATRANAVTWLTHLPETDAEATMSWLAARICDEHPIVRRHACIAAEQLTATPALPVLMGQIAIDTDGAAIEGLAYTAVHLADDDELRRIAPSLFERPRAWRAISHYLVERLDATALLQLLGRPVHDLQPWEELLTAVMQMKQSPDSWSAGDVEVLARTIVLRGRDANIFQHLDAITDLVAAHPQAALDGAVDAAAEIDVVGLTDVLFLSAVPNELLKGCSTGPLATIVPQLLARTPRSDARPPRLTPRGQSRRHTSRPAPDYDGPDLPTAPDPDHMPLDKALARNLYSPERPPQNRTWWPVESLSDVQREQLSRLVKAWWPKQPICALVPGTSSAAAVDGSTFSIIVAAASLDFPLTEENWHDVFRSGLLPWGRPAIAAWLQRTYSASYLPRAIESVGDLPDLRFLAAAASALNLGNHEAAEAIMASFDRLPGIDAVADVLDPVLDAGRLDLGHTAYNAEPDAERKQSIGVALANRGHVDAQLDLLEILHHQATAGQLIDKDLLAWESVASDERLVEPLGALLLALPDDYEIRDGTRHRIHRALASIGSDLALTVYDRVAATPNRPELAFEWYPRNELARSMATAQVLNRLPTSPNELLHLFSDSRLSTL